MHPHIIPTRSALSDPLPASPVRPLTCPLCPTPPLSMAQAGADPFEPNAEGYDACGTARSERHYHVVSLLEDLVKIGQAQLGKAKG